MVFFFIVAMWPYRYQLQPFVALGTGEVKKAWEEEEETVLLPLLADEDELGEYVTCCPLLKENLGLIPVVLLIIPTGYDNILLSNLIAEIWGYGNIWSQ